MGNVLIVRHGPGRGPRIRLRALRPGYMEPFFSWLGTHRPELGRRLRYWETGTSPPDLFEASAVVFLLQDPLRELFPACFEEASGIEESARRNGIRVVNSPSHLSNSIKGVQSRRWLAAGLETPAQIPCASLDELLAAGEKVRFPVVVRSDRLHSQQGVRFCRRRRDLEEVAPTAVFPCAVASFIDTRAGWAASRTDTPWATHYHKKRAMIFGDRVRNNHLFFSTDPIVGFKSSTFSHGRSFNPYRRWRGNHGAEGHLQADLAFFDGESEHETNLLRGSQSLGLEFVAIDYSSRADGSMILWEANPHFALHMWPLAILPEERRIHRRIAVIHQLMSDFFAELAGGTDAG